MRIGTGWVSSRRPELEGDQSIRTVRFFDGGEK